MSYIVESDFICEGLRCVVVFGDLGHRCGYVGVPKGNPLHGKDYFDPALAGVECHGGLTYSGGRNYPVLNDDGLWWFGFDCDHAWDAIDIDALKSKFPDSSHLDLAELPWKREGHVWTQQEVENECRRLVQELKEKEK